MIRLLWTAVCAALLVWAPMAPASADGAGATAQSQVPLPYSLSAQGANGTAEALIALPESSSPIVFSGVIKSTFTVPGQIIVSVGDRRAATVDALTGGSVTFPMTASDLIGGRVRIGLSVSLAKQDDCFTDDTSRAVLSDGVITFVYPVTPLDTVATFLSAGVTSYRVVTPAVPNPSVRAAALDAVAGLTLRYPAPTQVSVVATDEPVRGDYLNRIVRIQLEAPPDGAANMVAVVDGDLVVSGLGQALADAATALGDPNTGLIDSRSVANLSATTGFRTLSGPHSLTDLGVPPVSVAGIGRQEVTISLPQTAFGQQIEKMDIRLNGALTPLPEGGQGRVDLVWNEQLFTSVAMSSATHFERILDIPANLMQRDNSLKLVMLYVPPGGRCFPPGIGARFDVDTANSIVNATPGASVAPGFTVLPQAWPATVPVAFGPGATEAQAMEQAGHLVAAVQAAGTQQFAFTAVRADEFVSKRMTGLLVGATGSTLDALQAPLRGEVETTLGPAQSGFSAMLTQPFASLQAFTSGNSAILVLGRNDVDPENQPASDAMAGQLAAQVQSQADGYRALTGQVVVLGRSGTIDPVAINQPPAPDKARTMWIATGVGLLVLALVVLMWLWRRPRRPAPPSPV